MGIIRNFEKISKDDALLAGGKGASLGEMTQAGISVPPGFVILSMAFEKFLEETDLNVEIDSILHSINHKEIHTIENASEKIKALMLNAEMPKNIAEEIQNFFKQLRVKYVAVRSSATAEDSASAAWAGQLESYLNTTKENLLENVKKCWASLFTPRAIFYRFEKELHKQKISVAVVIQKMVESEISGVAFSVHPITQDRNQLIIEAGLGLGEAIVSGQITPDSYVVEKEPRRIIDKNISEQKKGIFRSGNQNDWIMIDKEKQGIQKLSDEKILELSELIVKIENHYGFPCDIEWAFENGMFYIVQSRPITTLADKIETVKYFKKDDYILSFWVQGVSIFVTDIHRDVYAHLGILFIIDRGMFKQYFKKRAYKQALNDGLKFYSDKNAVKEYRKNLQNHCKDFREFFDIEIKGKENISKKTLGEFFAFTTKLIGDYTKMNFEYTDKAFSEREKNKTIEDNLSLITSFKDEIRAFMNKVLFESDGYLNYIFKVLGKQFSVSPSLLDNLTQKEILSLFSGANIDKPRVMRRQEAFVYSYKNVLPYEGEEARKIKKEFEEEIVATDELKGQIASKGKVLGKVKIIPVDYSNLIRVNNEIEKMEKGDILVAETTAPELIVACRKAGAIVTDMGGLMSHAAIVSRELGIPCIVGTKNASKILKDGDLVEVDANKGVVKILERHPTTILSDDKVKELEFEFEYQREAPISLFYVWFYGHCWAYKKLLGMDSVLAEKVFAVHDNGTWKAYTQRDNLNKIKEKIKSLDIETLSEIVEEYLKDYRLFLENADLILRKDFINQLIGRFVVVFILGDLSEHSLQEKAFKAREETEKLFYLVWETLKSKSEARENFGLYSYSEIVSNTKLSGSVLAGRKKSLLTQDSIVPIKNEKVDLARYLTEQHIQIISEFEKVVIKLRHIVTRKYGLITSDLFVQGLSNPKNYKKLLLIDAFVSSGVILDRWCLGPQIRELGRKLLAQEEQEEGFVDKVFSNVYKFGENLLEYSKQIKSRDISKTSNDDLVRTFKDFSEQYKTFSVNLAGLGLTAACEARLRDILSGRANLDEDLAILSSPVKQNIINLEQEALLNIGVDVQKQKISLNKFEQLPKNITQQITNHVEEFGWMTRGGLDDSWEPQDVFERLREMVKENCEKKLGELSKHKKEAQEKSAKLLDEMDADKQLRRLANIAKELVYYRTYRTDYLNLIMFNVRPLLIEIGRRIGNYDFQEISYFREQEIIDWQTVDKKEVARRMQNFFLFAIEPNKIIFSSDPEQIRKIETKYLEQEKVDLKKIKGSVAFRGKVVGRVVIVLSKKDLPKVERGDVIVSTMTTPDYIVAMEKAAAFITDEGGITCHAAIVSRELKKPCIIGTKIATQVLKDGDLVEVDADSGIVRIIKNEN